MSKKLYLLATVLITLSLVLGFGCGSISGPAPQTIDNHCQIQVMDYGIKNIRGMIEVKDVSMDE